jgi:hypothetical protein
MRTLLTSSLLLISTTALANPVLEVPSLQVTDQEIVNLSCDAQQGILLAGPAVVASLAGRHDALSSCATGEFATVSWRWSADGEALVSVDKASSDAVKACVEAAIVPQHAQIEGYCTAQVPLGETVQAAASR